MVKSHRWSILAVVIILIGCVMVGYLWYSQLQEPFSTRAPEIQVIQLNPDAFEGNHAFNPSIIFYNDSTYSNTIDEIEPGKTNLILTYRSQPEQFHSDTKLIVKEKNTLTYQDNHQLSISLDASNKTYDYNDDFKYEDARFVILNQTPYLNYTSITRNGDGGITSIKNKLCEYQHPKHTAQFESLNSLQGIQKNWILFEYNGETFIIYELLPHLKVFRRGDDNDDDDLQLVTDQLYTTAPEIRGGTSPIILDDKLYIFGHYSVQGASTTFVRRCFTIRQWWWWWWWWRVCLGFLLRKLAGGCTARCQIRFLQGCSICKILEQVYSLGGCRRQVSIHPCYRQTFGRCKEQKYHIHIERKCQNLFLCIWLPHHRHRRRQRQQLQSRWFPCNQRSMPPLPSRTFSS